MLIPISVQRLVISRRYKTGSQRTGRIATALWRSVLSGAKLRGSDYFCVIQLPPTTLYTHDGIS